MKIFFYFLFFFTFSVAWASGEAGKLLPDKFQGLNFGKTTIEQFERQVGSPKLQESKGKTVLIFYNIFGVDYDVTVSFRDRKLSTIYISGFSKEWFFKDFRKLFSEAEINKAYKVMNEIQGHEKGRFFELSSKKEGFRLRFSNYQEHRLESVVLWKPGNSPP